MTELAAVEDKGPDREQLALFEGEPVHAYKASLAAGGFLTIGEEFKVGSRVAVSCEGTVSKVTFIKRNGVTTRQHVIVIDSEETTIEAI